jgi:magnesium chelatase family protein
MLAKVRSCAVLGLDGELIEVEVDQGRGLPSFVLVGLPDAAVKESGQRVEAAIKNSHLTWPRARLTINLAPANLRKEGPAYDLPIALGVLAASAQIPPQALEGALVVGELSLDGSVRHVRGILPMAAAARREGIKTIYVPAEDAAEAALIPDVSVIGVPHLAELVNHLHGASALTAFDPASLAGAELPPVTDMREVKGQEHVKRALEVAAAGFHNVLMVGPPGAGKTLLARAMPGIMPALSIDESLEVTKIYSVCDLLPPETPLIQVRPFRAPHHTISQAGLVGGGRWPRPGEISLAHRGLLFLDELPEFGQRTLEVLRQPLEDKRVTISRAQGTLTFPANFMMIAAMNPCPCGHYGDPGRECTCSMGMVSKYQKRLSGPLLDRIDIHVEVPRVEYEKLADERLGEPSADIRARVEAARERQRERFAAQESSLKLNCNADMQPADVRVHCPVDEAGKGLLKAAMAQLQLSARAYHRILKLARTIADLAGSEEIRAPHLAEAIQYRPRRQF